MLLDPLSNFLFLPPLVRIAAAPGREPLKGSIGAAWLPYRLRAEMGAARGGGREQNAMEPARSRLSRASRAAVLLATVAVGFFYLMIAAGGASFINECNSLVCAQLHQALFAAVGAVALFVTAYRFSERRPSAKIAFFGTLPLLIVHVILVIEDPNESIFFPLSTAPPPVISAAAFLLRRRATTS